MIYYKTFSIAISLLLFSVILVNSVEIKCSIASTSSIAEYNVNQKNYLVLLNQKNTASENISVINDHLNFLENCWNINSRSILDESNISALNKEVSKHNV